MFILEIRWSDASLDSQQPALRLAEMFNVNHFILSQANPYLLPFVERSSASPWQSQTWLSKFASLVSSEIKHRLFQMEQFGLLPHWLSGLADQQMTGNVVLFPDIKFTDYHIVLSNPTSGMLDHWILKGEQAVWPKLALIRDRLAIELKLDSILMRLRGERPRADIQLLQSPPQSPPSFTNIGSKNNHGGDNNMEDQQQQQQSPRIRVRSAH
jgi:TAG lipase/lysophosphatidylethanolamine acyltransferase